MIKPLSSQPQMTTSQQKVDEVTHMAAERYPTKEKAEVEIYGRSGGLIARIKDLSQTGACLIWENSGESLLSKGDLLRVRVVLKALKREHHMNAEVIWTQGQQTGIQFLSSSEVVEKMMSRGL